jgi:outer membrane protein assembly factor BamB
VALGTHALAAWNPQRACSGCNRYWDLVADGTSVYVATRNAGAATAFDRSTGALRWRVNANGDGQALAMADGLLYVGGHFSTIGRSAEPRSILAALNPLTGAIDPNFRPRFVTSFPGIWALAATSARLYVGGHFTAAGASPPKRYPYFAMFR